MVHLSAAGDSVNRELHAELIDSVESGPAAAFMVMGLLGTVLGILLLSIGLWRARVAPRWAAPALLAFLIVEFVGTAISDWASQVAGLLFLSAFVALAVTIWHSPRVTWQTGYEQSDTGHPAPATAS